MAILAMSNLHFKQKVEALQSETELIWPSELKFACFKKMVHALGTAIVKSEAGAYNNTNALFEVMSWSFASTVDRTFDPLKPQLFQLDGSNASVAILYQELLLSTLLNPLLACIDVSCVDIVLKKLTTVILALLDQQPTEDEAIDAVTSAISCCRCLIHVLDTQDNEYVEDYEAVLQATPPESEEAFKGMGFMFHNQMKATEITKERSSNIARSRPHTRRPWMKCCRVRRCSVRA